MNFKGEENWILHICVEIGVGAQNCPLIQTDKREAGNTLAKFHLFTHFQRKQNREYCDHITFVLIWNKGKQGCTYNHCYENKQWDSSSDHKNHTKSTVLSRSNSTDCIYSKWPWRCTRRHDFKNISCLHVHINAWKKAKCQIM